MPVGRRPNYFAPSAPVAAMMANDGQQFAGASAAPVSWRDMAQDKLRGMIGGRNAKHAMTALDFTPVGAAFMGNEARMAANRGNTGEAAAGVALAALPLPGAAKKGMIGGAKKGITAYHGSPHTFDRFSLDKIGTGEGAQAYGHGLYFAEAEDTARSYRDALTTRGDDAAGWNMTVRGKRVEDIYSQIEQRAARMPIKDAQIEYDRLSAIESLMQHGDPQGVVSSGQIEGPALDWFNREIAPHFKRDGSMYQVSIDADPADFLDWDAPLSGQSEKVRDTLQGFIGQPAGTNSMLDMRYGAAPKKAGDGYEYKSTGGQVYGNLNTGGGVISQKLREAGIPGIKYLDQGSRTAGDGSRNYVVFDDKLISILKRYGWVPGMAIPAAAMTEYEAQYGPQQGGDL